MKPKYKTKIQNKNTKQKYKTKIQKIFVFEMSKGGQQNILKPKLKMNTKRFTQINLKPTAPKIVNKMVKICPNHEFIQENQENQPQHTLTESFNQFPYPLSPFQKYSIQAILEGQHILVTAPTGSGKTLPAEFAIQYFTQTHQKRVIYTSPIKALSNQKYYQFSQAYPHISFGLLTGDIKTNPTAQVLLMTTEILMNYLLLNDAQHTESPPSGGDEGKGTGELSFQLNINDLAAVVFDEVHYINDKDRGQNWEKTLLLLPPNIQRIMLSATIHSPERFAQWVEDAPHERCLKGSVSDHQGTEKQPRKQVWICSSPTRVVPLHHFAYLVVPNGVYKKPTPQIANNHQTNLKTQSQTKNPHQKQQPQTQTKTQPQKNQKPTLTKEQEQELKNMTQKLLPLTPKEIPQTHASIKKAIEYIKYTQTQITRPFVLNQLFKQLRDEEKLPAIAFVFSRKNVERCAQEITVPLLEDDSKVPYTTARDCEQIIRRLPNYQEFLKLPEYVTLVKLLEKGIGIHHSGMIPILREIVELQISQKKIKLLFATESFAIGLDCPIRTVVFTEIRKYDGTEERILMPHEYTQMAGRAGRRGIDTVGYVVHANNLFDLPTKTEYQHLVSGANQTLESKFRISYELVLSLLSLNQPHAQTQENLAHFVKNSMLQNEIQKEYQGLETEYQRLLANCPPQILDANEKDLESYLELKSLLPTLVNKRKKEVQKEMERIETEIPDLETKLQHFIQKKDWDKNKTKLETQMQLNRQTISYQISHILDILSQRGMIQTSSSCLEKEQEQETQAWTLTEKGTLAAPMTEIHPLLFGQHLHQFKDLSTTEWIALLSCFAGMKKDDKNPGINSAAATSTWGKQRHPEHENVLQLLDNLLMPTIRELQNEEVNRNLYTGTNYEEMGNPLITRFVMDWCGCESEEDCKWILQTKLPETVSLGDFTKAVLKIIAISKQLVSILENKPEWLEIVSSLSKVEGNVAKYVVSCQSLYV